MANSTNGTACSAIGRGLGSEDQESMKIKIAIPESWRMELMMDPRKRSQSLESLETSPHQLEILDWNDALSPETLLVVAALDLSTAELVVKLPADAAALGLLSRGAGSGYFGGRRRLLRQARRRLRWIQPPYRPSSVPRDLCSYIEPAVVYWEQA